MCFLLSWLSRWWQKFGKKFICDEQIQKVTWLLYSTSCWSSYTLKPPWLIDSSSIFCAFFGDCHVVIARFHRGISWILNASAVINHHSPVSLVAIERFVGRITHTSIVCQENTTKVVPLSWSDDDKRMNMTLCHYSRCLWGAGCKCAWWGIQRCYDTLGHAEWQYTTSGIQND